MKKFTVSVILLFSILLPVYSQTEEGIEIEKESLEYRCSNYENVAHFCQDIEILTKKIKKRSKASYYKQRALTKQRMGYNRLAIEDYNEAIDLKPDFSLAYNNRGVAKTDIGDFDGALKDLNESIKLRPKFSFPYNSRGNLKRKKGDLKGAISDYSESLKLKRSSLVFKNRSTVKFMDGDYLGGFLDLVQSFF